MNYHTINRKTVMRLRNLAYYIYTVVAPLFVVMKLFNPASSFDNTNRRLAEHIGECMGNHIGKHMREYMVDHPGDHVTLISVAQPHRII